LIVKKKIFAIAIFLWISHAYCQQPTDYFDELNPNIAFIEHLVKTKIDEVSSFKG
jgi:hypothetical protein